jgi:hypothetical protein
MLGSIKLRVICCPAERLPTAGTVSCPKYSSTRAASSGLVARRGAGVAQYSDEIARWGERFSPSPPWLLIKSDMRAMLLETVQTGTS